MKLRCFSSLVKSVEFMFKRSIKTFLNEIILANFFSLYKEMTLKLSPNADHCNRVACRTDIGLFKRGVSHEDQFDVSCCFLLPMV